MTKKDLYTSPQVDILELDYADPVCQATSGVPDYGFLDGSLIEWD